MGKVKLFEVHLDISVPLSGRAGLFSRKARVAFVAILAASFALASPVTAQAPALSEEDLFSGSASLVTSAGDGTEDLVTENLEKFGGVEIGGTLRLAWSADLEDGKLANRSGATGSGLGLFFDARPEKNLRAYGRFRYTVSDSDFSGAAEIDELFGDLSMGAWGRLRVGKQAAVWGLGYWWSPADILSLVPIDEADPEAEREGTVALKYSLPAGLGGVSFYTTLDGADSADSIGFAARGEFLIGSAEFGIGGYWRPDGKLAPRAVGTASFDLGPVDAYAELVLSGGSDAHRVSFEGGSPTLSKAKEALISGAFGAAWMESDPEGRWDIALLAEYYYNGTGILEADAYARNRPALLALAGSGRLSVAELTGYGRHYGAIAGKFEDLGDTGLGLNLGARSNIGEGSIWYEAAAVWEPIADFRAKLGVEGSAGPVGGEYSPGGNASNFSASTRIFEKATISFSWPLTAEGAPPSLGFVFSTSF